MIGGQLSPQQSRFRWSEPRTASEACVLHQLLRTFRRAQKQGTGLWVRPWQERGKVRVTPELCCRVFCLVFWPTPSESLQAVQDCGCGCDPTTLPHGEDQPRVDRDIHSHSEHFLKRC